MNRFFFEKNKMIWYGGMLFYAASIVFLLISLFSYNPTDSSWLYVSSGGGAVSNQAGFLGAQLAAILFYFFGGASFLWLIPLLLVGFFLFYKTINS